MVCDSHRLALEQNKNVMPYPFTDTPDIVSVIIKEHGIDKVKEFLDKRLEEGRGIDIRKFSKEINKNFQKDEIIPVKQEKDCNEYNFNTEPMYYIPIKKRNN